MCNLYRLNSGSAEVGALFGATVASGANTAGEVYPGYPGLVLTGATEPQLRAMAWGFPVSLTGKQGQKLKPKPVNNARFDKLNGFWRRWTGPEHRCLIPINAYAEAVGEKGKMTRTWLSVRDQPIVAWAGLWRRSDEWGDVYTGVMTDCDPELAEIHDRAPVLLEPEDWQAWLTEPLSQLGRFDRPTPAARMVVEMTEELWAKPRAKPAESAGLL